MLIPSANSSASWSGLSQPGARGLKIWKDVGLGFRHADGRLVCPDDDVVIEVVRAAGERIEELAAHPDWWFGGDGMPGFYDLLGAFERLAAACPDTVIVGAHVGNCAEDLGLVRRMLETYDNYYVDLGARMGELGRQPRAARRLIVDHADRVLFGTDNYPLTDTRLRHWFRFLETDDECFDYAPGREVPPQGRWQVAALDLPDDVLRQVYADNARRVLR